MATKSSSPFKALTGRGLWPLWGILIIGVILLFSRPSADGGSASGSDAGSSPGATPTTVTKTVTAPRAGSGGTSRAGGAGGAEGAEGADSTLTRGPAGTPITPTARSIARCDVDRLPPQARTTIDLVQAGGPFPYPRNDGVLFRNSAKLLPVKPSGYYREYTVVTPDAQTRATRRIVTGGDPPTQPDAWYYTGDHYESFCEITGLK